MQPCPECRRHVRGSELQCPFCGLDLRSSKISATAAVGAFAFAALAVLGTAACSKEPIASDGESGATTTTNGSSSSTTVIDETSESGMVDTETDTDDGSEDTTVTTGSFYAGPDIDFGSNPQCDPFQQDCPEGEKCVAYASTGGSWDANKCVPINGDGIAGDPCTYGGSVEATDDCAAGLYCWDVKDVEGQQIGVCTEFCQGGADQPDCAPGTSCLIAYQGSINLCLANCNPLLQDCEPGLGCYPVDDHFSCVATTQDIPVGQPCGFINDCVSGTACLPAELVPDCAGSECCASFCDLDSDQPCPQPGTECSPFFGEGMAPPEYVDIGVCVVP